jgi:hypothetical protein
MATQDQIQAIERRAYNDTTRRMAREGVTLSYEQVEIVGEEGIDWLQHRLGLQCTATHDGIECAVVAP